MRELKDIEKILKQSKQGLSQRYPIKSIAIFGSYARNEQSPDSDLDLLVEINGKIGSKFIDLADEIEQLIGMKVDLVSKNGIKEKYLKAIKDELIYV
ncbi:nucleotidyltransferase family protein [Litoribacter alkaliphilus]|uniref:Nucleotidyltransferase family protein n=1 Tax=Litoribacter ruber TaxID=702568 RepID=A0AAP2CEM5_9BACT|nr:nucleotidyltransferase family protein [Litoribacter alkaliphilus]MBS9522948.1 nucleotidyltransferase family protein [Litoribacter alkaliphilus]